MKTTICLQIPSGVPHPDTNKPVDLSDPADVIIYIILPLLAALLIYLWYKRRKGKG
jgi:hypothetical protein